MKKQQPFRLASAIAIVVAVLGSAMPAAAEDESASKAGENVAVEGQFIRVAENAEGWVVMGYTIANDSVGQEWMLLNVGLTVQGEDKEQVLYRDDITLVTPDGEVLALPSQEAFNKAAGTLDALDARANMVTESINYFPPDATIPCRLGFFADAAQAGRTLAYDQVSLNSRRACVGRLYFQVPGGIKLGLYNLDVQFEGGVVRLPFKIMTKEEAKEFEQQWKQERKESKKH
jgi:hypothetical protein